MPESDPSSGSQDLSATFAHANATLDQLRAEVLATFVDDLDRAAPDVRGLAATFAYEQIWPRDGLSTCDRSIVTIAAIVALGCTDELKLHVIRGLEHGITKDEIGEVLTHLIPYVGFPLVVKAASAVGDLVERAGAGDQS